MLTDLRRVTSDPGLTAEPCLSSNDKFVVYASDRTGDANLDVWLHEVESAAIHRLTFHAADDREPSISPDGEQIAFRSDRDGGGIYVMPANGGENLGRCAPSARPRGFPRRSRLRMPAAPAPT